MKALIGRAFWALPDADECARLGGELAEKLGDVELRSAAFDARAGAAFRAGDYAGAHTWAMRRFDFLPELSSPDLIHDTYLSAIPTAAALGRIREARRLAGRADRARELESAADEFPNEGFGATLGTPRARLALARAELDRVEELLGDDDWMQRQIWFSLPAAAAHLDSLAVVGSAADVETAAERLGQPRSYLEPFGLRALGVAHEDEALLGRADEAFRAMGLNWHAAQTGPLRALRKRALG